MEAPNIPTLADLPYPTDIKKKQKELDDLYSEWVEADAQVLELEEQLNEIAVRDSKALKEAAISGEPDPGPLDTNEVERALL